MRFKIPYGSRDTVTHGHPVVDQHMAHLLVAGDDESWMPQQHAPHRLPRTTHTNPAQP